MALHKKHRVIIALGNNDDVYRIEYVFFFSLFKDMGSTMDKNRAVIEWLR